MSTGNLREAVRSLRVAMGLTQTKFAERVSVSLPTVQRWEKVVPPRGKALYSLSRLASEIGKMDLSSLFLSALTRELSANERVLLDKSETKEERYWKLALVALLRNRQFPSLWRDVEKVQAAILKAHDRLIDSWDVNHPEQHVTANKEAITGRALDEEIDQFVDIHALRLSGDVNELKFVNQELHAAVHQKQSLHAFPKRKGKTP
jgi:transcriptional regulator with XRE-family HTH domain